MSEYKIKDHLLKNSPEFRKLYDKHQKYEKELAKLTQKSNISSEEAVDLKILKKKKLSVKDSMQKMILEYGKFDGEPI
jgi:uncharacterized protein YdcH (DUF465 family)